MKLERLTCRERVDLLELKTRSKAPAPARRALRAGLARRARP